MQQMQSRSPTRPDIREDSPLAQDTADLARRALTASLAGLAVATGYHTGPVSLVFIATWGMAGCNPLRTTK
jgi:hypothetical protein